MPFNLENQKVLIQPGYGYNPVTEVWNDEPVEDFVHTISGNSFVSYEGWCVGLGCAPVDAVEFFDETAPQGLEPSSDTLQILEQIKNRL